MCNLHHLRPNCKEKLGTAGLGAWGESPNASFPAQAGWYFAQLKLVKKGRIIGL